MGIKKWKRETFFPLDATTVARFRRVVTIWARCRNNSERKTLNYLKYDEKRPNFALAKISEMISLFNNKQSIYNIKN